MRLFVAAAVVLVCGAACGHPSAPEPRSTSAAPAPSGGVATVNPARIDRVRQQLPPGYEVVGLGAGATPVSLWGFGPDWTAEPAACAQPLTPGTQPARGWSASGPGGIVYAAIAEMDGAAPGQDPRCEQWQVAGGHSVGTVTAVPAPVIEGADTAGTATAVTTTVEGGTETRSHADTFTATLDSGADRYHVFVTVITDPGSPNPALDSAFSADLLVKTVSAVRG